MENHNSTRKEATHFGTETTVFPYAIFTPFYERKHDVEKISY